MLTTIHLLCDCYTKIFCGLLRLPKFASAVCSREAGIVCVNDAESLAQRDIWQQYTSFANWPPKAQDCRDIPAKQDSLAKDECSYTGHNRPRTEDISRI